MDFWELQQEVGATQKNIWWLKGELKREKKSMRRLQKALIAASDAAKGN
jgi:5-bromo-4-chloroindolyl phosphate hydrolysis protein